MKKIILLITLVTTVLLSANLAFADNESIEITNEEIKIINLEDIEEKSVNYDLIINQSTQQYKYLEDWGTTFRYLGNGKLSAVGYTETSQNVDTITTTVYLQQYDESRKAWVNIDSISNTESNYYYSNTSRTYVVPTGFRFRLLSIHKATVNGVAESASSYSSAITIY